MASAARDGKVTPAKEIAEEMLEDRKRNRLIAGEVVFYSREEFGK
jgi:hypothetical protein